MTKEQIPSHEAVRIELAKRKLINFISFTKKDYSVNWHHKRIADKLDSLRRREFNKLMIFVPPQHGKSEIATRRFPAHVLGHYPKTKIVITSYSDTLATSFNRDIQRIIDEEEYAQLFPDTYLNSSNVVSTAAGGFLRNSSIFETVGHEGFVKTVGVGGSLTGTPVNLGIIDDPLKDREQAESETIREKVWNWYTDVFETRLHNDSQQIIILTRWHSDDLAGKLLERDDDWEVLTIPAIKEDDDKEDPREIGEALWPKRHSLEKLLKVKADSPYTFSSLFQQNPSTKGGMIWKATMFKVCDVLPRNLESVGTDWDLAYTKNENNSASAWITSGTFNGNMYISHLGYQYCEFPELINLMHTRQMPHYIENKASGKSAKQTLNSMSIPAIEIGCSSDKIARANTASPYAESGMVYVMREFYDLLLHDSKQGILAFPNGKGDDLADTLAQAIYRQFLNKTRFKI